MRASAIVLLLALVAAPAMARTLGQHLYTNRELGLGGGGARGQGEWRGARANLAGACLYHQNAVAPRPPLDRARSMVLVALSGALMRQGSTLSGVRGRGRAEWRGVGGGFLKKWQFGSGPLMRRAIAPRRPPRHGRAPRSDAALANQAGHVRISGAGGSNQVSPRPCAEEE